MYVLCRITVTRGAFCPSWLLVAMVEFSIATPRRLACVKNNKKLWGDTATPAPRAAGPLRGVCSQPRNSLNRNL